MNHLGLLWFLKNTLTVTSASPIWLKTTRGDVLGEEYGGYCVYVNGPPSTDFEFQLLGAMEKMACWRKCALQARARGCDWVRETNICILHKSLVEHGTWYHEYECLVLRGNIILRADVSIGNMRWGIPNASEMMHASGVMTDGVRVNDNSSAIWRSNDTWIQFTLEERTEISYVVVTHDCTSEERIYSQVHIGTGYEIPSECASSYQSACVPVIMDCHMAGDRVYLKDIAGSKLTLVEVEAYHSGSMSEIEMLAHIPHELTNGNMTIMQNGHIRSQVLANGDESNKWISVHRNASLHVDLHELSTIHLVAIKWCDSAMARNVTIYSSDLLSTDAASTLTFRHTEEDTVAHPLFPNNSWTTIGGWPEATKSIRLKLSEGGSTANDLVMFCIQEIVVLGVLARAFFDPVNGGWTRWSECTKPCGRQFRYCTAPLTKFGGIPCQGTRFRRFYPERRPSRIHEQRRGSRNVALLYAPHQWCGIIEPFMLCNYRREDLHTPSCPEITDEETCVTARDGRHNLFWNQPCIWCCGFSCTGNPNPCEPLNFLHYDKSWNERGRHIDIIDNCTRSTTFTVPTTPDPPRRNRLRAGTSGRHSKRQVQAPSCPEITDEETCITARDGRHNTFSNQPCIWCCGFSCTGNPNPCEPLNFLLHDKSWNERGRHIGIIDNCTLDSGM